MASIITANLNVSFSSGSASGGILVAEIDGREDGFNGGDTSFAPGDNVYYLTYRGPDVTIDSQHWSQGNFSAEGQTTIEVTEDLEFFGKTDLEQSVRYPIIDGSLSGLWLGQSAGNVVASGPNTLKVNTPTTPAPYFAGVYRATYSTKADVFRLSNTLILNVGDYSIAGLIVATYDPTV